MTARPHRRGRRRGRTAGVARTPSPALLCASGTPDSRPVIRPRCDPGSHGVLGHDAAEAVEVSGQHHDDVAIRRDHALPELVGV